MFFCNYFFDIEQLILYLYYVKVSPKYRYYHINMFKKIINFYISGFKNMPVYGRRLWLIILIKAFIMFAVLKVFFFQGHLKKFKTDQEKIDYVSEQLITIK